MDYFVQKTLDLHGMEVYEAKVRVDEFLTDCGPKVQQVTLVHGKGTYALSNYFQNEYRHKRIQRIVKAANTGETILVLKVK